MRFLTLGILLTCSQAFSQAEIHTGVGGSTSSNGLGPAAKVTLESKTTFISGRVSNLMTGTENGKSYLEYDLELNTDLFRIGNTPITAGYQASNRFYKQEHQFMAGVKFPSRVDVSFAAQAGIGLSDLNSRFGSETQIEFGASQLVDGETYTAEKPVEDVQAIVDNNPELFADTTYNIPLRALIGDQLEQVPSLKLMGSYVPYLGTLKIDARVGLGYAKYDINSPDKIIESTETPLNYIGLAVVNPPVSYNYLRINPGVRVTKDIGSKLRIWLDAEYNHDQLQVNATELSQKLQRSNGFVSIGVAIKLNGLNDGYEYED